MALLPLIILSILGPVSLWETTSAGTPKSSPLLAPTCGIGLDIYIALGESGLGGWDSSGNPLSGFPVSTGGSVTQRPACVYFPALDKYMIIFGDSEGCVHAVDRYGYEAPGWPFETGSSIVTGITCIDIDENCWPEIFFGTSDGKLYALSTAAESLEGWPVSAEAQPLFQPAILPVPSENLLVWILCNTKIFAYDSEGKVAPGWPVSPGFAAGTAPVTADIDADGSFDVILATAGRRIVVLNSLGRQIDGWPYSLDDRPVSPSLAVGMLDEHQKAAQIAVSSRDGLVYLMNPDGTLAGTWRWPNRTYSRPTSPIISWVNGEKAVIVASDNGEIYAWNAEGRFLSGFPFSHSQPVSQAPAVGDLDGDGSSELIIAGRSGLIAAYPLSSYPAEAGPWPQTSSDFSNTSSYGIDFLPRIQVGEIFGEKSGDVTLDYDLIKGSYININVAFSTDAGYTWSNTENYIDLGNSILWHTNIDLPSLDVSECRLRITPLCSMGTGIAGTSTIFHVDNNLPPAVYLNSPNEEDIGNRIMLAYSLEDSEGDIIQLQAQYSLDGGSTWSTAHLQGSTLEIEPWLYGDPVFWDVERDLGSIECSEAVFRLRAADADPGPWSSIDGLDLDTDCLPSAQIIAPVDEVGDIVELGVRIADPEENPLDIEYEYSTDGGITWKAATITDASMSRIENYRYNVYWNSTADIPGRDLIQVRFRAIPSDADRGIAVASAPFHVDNNSEPSITIISPGSFDVFHGLVPICFRIFDPEGDNICLGLEYRLATERETWTTAEGVQNRGPFSGGSFDATLNWNSSVDMPGVDEIEIHFRVIAFDMDTVRSEQIGPVVISNTDLPEILSVSVMRLDQSEGKIIIAFQLNDPDEDPIDLTVEYSADRGNTWRNASISGNLFSLRPHAYSGTLEWFYKTDVPEMENGVLLRITPSSSRVGPPRILSIDLL